MYLISIYFDTESSNKIQKLINKVAEKSGNDFMTQGKVPPHITIAAFQTSKEDEVIEILDSTIKGMKVGPITFASIGVFKSSVIFLAPVLNEYLHNLSEEIYNCISSIDNLIINKFYIPFQWMPHATIAKKLSKDELFLAFRELEKHFNIFNGKVTKIALSKTNPYEDIVVWEFN